MVRAFYMDTNEDVSLEHLKSLGVQHWVIDADTHETNPFFNQLKKDNGYSYTDYVDSRKIPNFNDKLATFFEEHIHDDDEIRFFLDGTGYFDVRDASLPHDPWVRIVCSKSDLITIPAGIYHRFSPDDKLFFHVMRLFIGDPIWTPYNRVDKETDARAARLAYETKFIQRTQ